MDRAMDLHKGPNIASLDPPGTGKLTLLFHPRRDDWAEHFHHEKADQVGTTAVGRATVFLLDINNPLRVDLRQSLMDEGVFPQDPRLSNKAE
jgi:hypothetical protein